MLAALFVAYDGESSLWSEAAEGTGAGFALEPIVAVATSLAGL